MVSGTSFSVATSYGSEFYIGFMRNIGGTTISRFKLTVGTSAQSNVSFMIENNAGIVYTGMVTSTSPVVVDMDNDNQVLGNNFNNRHKGIRVYSTEDEPLYVLVQNFVRFLNQGVYLAYPCFSLGPNINQYKYGVITVGHPSNTLNSQFLLIGCENDTVITITPTKSVLLPTDAQMSSTTVSIDPGMQSHEITLNKMQTLLVSSIDDLTGTIITSDKPLTVISGHECANVPLSEAGCEPLAVQVPPVATWGTQFLIAPFAGRSGDQAFKAVSSTSNTSIDLSCDSRTAHFAPDSIFSFFSGSYCYLQSTDPIFLVELSFGGSLDRRGDPAMSIISPVDQYIHDIDFISLPSRDFQSNYISVTVATDHYQPENILLDGEAINCMWFEIRDGDSNIVGYGCNKTISSNIRVPEKHNISHSGNGELSVLVYGFSSFPAQGYSYLAGQVLEATEGMPTGIGAYIQCLVA
jgi:hypothetical protein